MKKFIYGILGLALILYLGLNKLYYDPEEALLKHLKRRYKKEFTVLYSSSIPSREGTIIYDAKILPIEYFGTAKGIDSYYRAEGSISGKTISDSYINILVGESANEFYLPKLKELFGENIFSVFRIEGKCEKTNIQEELARRKKIYEKEQERYQNETYSYMKHDFDPLRINIYIFGNEKDVKMKELYREKIYKFIEYLKETDAFYYTTLSVKLIDEEIFTEEKFEEIKKRQEEENIKNKKEFDEYLERTMKWSLINPYVEVEITTDPVEDNNSKEKDENTNETAEYAIKNVKDIMNSGLISTTETILNEYGKTLISSYIVSPKRAVWHVGERTYINPYEKMEDIVFEGEEIKYPNGTIKELSKDGKYYITEIKNNKRNGISTQYDNAGKVIWVGEFKDNILDGSFKGYDEYGYIIEGTYKNDLLEGEVTRTTPKGEVIKEIYKNGLLDGTKVSYYEDGSIRGTAEYKKGKLNGTIVSFRKNGDIHEISEWKDGERNGKMIKYDFEGRIALMVEYKNGMCEGVFKEFLVGKLLEEREYKENLKHGITKIYYPNGKIKEEILYNEGRWLWKKSYSENGNLIKEIERTENGEIVKEYSENDGSLINIQ